MSFFDRDKWKAALTGFTPFGKGPLSVHWLREHPAEKHAILSAAAIVGAAYTGGASLGLLGGTAAAAPETAAALYGAGGGAMGGGMAAADYAGIQAAAGLGGSTLGGAGFSMEGGPAVLGAPYGGELASVGESGGTMLGSAPYGGELSSVGDTGGTMLGGSQPQELTGLLGKTGKAGDNFRNYQRAKAMFDLANHQTQQPQAAPVSPRPQPQLNDDTMAILRRIWPLTGS